MRKNDIQGTDSVESVNARLQELLEESRSLSHGLNAQLSERYRKFEHQVLSEMLYSKEHDQLGPFLSALIRY